jgi:hypothetical protein
VLFVGGVYLISSAIEGCYRALNVSIVLLMGQHTSRNHDSWNYTCHILLLMGQHTSRNHDSWNYTCHILLLMGQHTSRNHDSWNYTCHILLFFYL